MGGWRVGAGPVLSASPAVADMFACTVQSTLDIQYTIHRRLRGFHLCHRARSSRSSEAEGARKLAQVVNSCGSYVGLKSSGSYVGLRSSAAKS